VAEGNHDLVIVGAGSGNMLPSQQLDGWRIAVVESDRFGGTCLNRGCIPSKMLVHTADVAQTVQHAGRFGIDASWAGADWTAIRSRVFGRIDPLHERAVAHRRAGAIDVFLGEARFTGPRTLLVNGEEIRADPARPVKLPASAGSSRYPGAWVSWRPRAA
jgi:mycothione reductase